MHPSMLLLVSKQMISPPVYTSIVQTTGVKFSTIETILCAHTPPQIAFF